jgi:hypothetical protein
LTTSLDAVAAPGLSNNYAMLIRNLIYPSSTGKGSGIGFSSTSIGADNNIGASIIFNQTDVYSKGKLEFYTKQSDVSTTAPVKAMTIGDDGNVTVQNAITITAGDTTVTEVLGKIVYKTSDNHFYGCVYVGASYKSWKQLD